MSALIEAFYIMLIIKLYPLPNLTIREDVAIDFGRHFFWSQHRGLLANTLYVVSGLRKGPRPRRLCCGTTQGARLVTPLS